MDSSIILLVGILVTLFLFGGVAYTIVEFRRMYREHEEHIRHEEETASKDEN